MNDLLKIRVGHKSSIPGANWCQPIGWEPTNTVENAEWIDGSWWSEQEEEAGLVYFGPAGTDEEVEVSLGALRVASCGNCRVIEEVRV